jgi:signal transduction histidine kinase
MIEDGIRTIHRNAQMLATMIDDLLDIRRMACGELELECTPTSMAIAVRDAIQTTTPAAAKKGLTIEETFDAKSATVSADGTRLQQILCNVLNNAVKFTPPGGKVNVTVGETPTHVTVSIADTGSGIDPAELSYIFERFRPSNRTHSRREGGLGLGLAIAKHLSELHGGFIHADSPGKGRGSTFVIGLPRHPPNA